MINALTGGRTWGIQTLKFLISCHWYVVPNTACSVTCTNFLFRQSQAMKNVWMHYFNMVLTAYFEIAGAPIHLSAACGHIGVLGALLQSAASMDANPAMVDNHGYTALHWACYNG